MIKLKLKVFPFLAVLCCVFVFAACSSSNISQESLKENLTQSYEDFEYINADDGVTIVKYNGNNSKVDIPEKITGIDVTVIGESAFENNTYLKSVSIPDSVTTISRNAFYGCGKLEEVKFNDSSKLVVIGDKAFYSTNIQKFTIPENCKMVYDAFSDNLKDVYVYGKETAFSDNAVNQNTWIHGYIGSQADKQFPADKGYKFSAFTDDWFTVIP